MFSGSCHPLPSFACILVILLFRNLFFSAGRQSGFGNSRPGMASAFSGFPRVLAQLIVELLRAHVLHTAPVLGETMDMGSGRVQSPPPASQHSSQSGRLTMLNLEDPADYAQFSRRPQCASFIDRDAQVSPTVPKIGITALGDASSPGKFDRPAVASPSLVTNVGKVSGHVPHRIGWRGCPLYLTPSMSAELYELWGIFRPRRVAGKLCFAKRCGCERTHWLLSSGSGVRRFVVQGILEFWVAG